MCSSSRKLKIHANKNLFTTAIDYFLLHRLRSGDGSEVVDDDDVEAVLLGVKGTFVDDAILEEDEEDGEVGIAVVVVEAVLLDVKGTDADVEVVVVFIVEASLVDVRGTSVDDKVSEEDEEDDEDDDVKLAVVFIVVLLAVIGTFVDEEEDEEVVVVDTESEFPENHAYVTERLSY